MKQSGEYMGDISVLSRQATIQYFRDGDKNALTTLLNIAKIVLRNRLKKYDLQDEEVDDASQDLCEELLKIAKAFNIEKSDNFIGYVFNVIRFCAFKAVYRKMYPFLDKTDKRLGRCTKILSSYDDLNEGIENCKKVGLNQSVIDHSIAIRNTIHISIYDDAKTSDEGTKSEMVVDTIASDEDSIEDIFDNENMIKKLKEILSKMSDRDKDIVESTFFREESISSVAKRLGLSPQRVDQLQKKAVQHIRLQFDWDIGLNNINVLDVNRMDFGN